MKFTVWIFAFAVLLPAHAQNSPQLSQLGLKGTLDGHGQAPTPRDQYGNPIPVQEPSAAERQAAREAEAARVEKIRAAEIERLAAERLAAEERRAAEQLAEEKRFHDQIMTAVYIGLAILAALFVAVLVRRSR